MIQWRKIISFDFHHIPKLSIGFKLLKLDFFNTFYHNFKNIFFIYNEKVIISYYTMVSLL